VLSFENSGAVARYSANQAIVHRDEIDPDVAIARIDAVTFDDVDAVARAISTDVAVACVGPHSESDFN
jgi:predicted Zn-dependent peptidase